VIYGRQHQVALGLRGLAASLIIASLIDYAHCQQARSRQTVEMPPADYKPKIIINPELEREKAYRSAIGKLPNQNQKSKDPWEGVRTNSAAPTK